MPHNTQTHNGNPIPTEMDGTHTSNSHCLTSGTNWGSEVWDEEAGQSSSASAFLSLLTTKKARKARFLT